MFQTRHASQPDGDNCEICEYWRNVHEHLAIAMNSFQAIITINDLIKVFSWKITPTLDPREPSLTMADIIDNT